MDVDVLKCESHEMIQLEIQERELKKERWMTLKGKLIIIWGLSWKNQQKYENVQTVFGIKRIIA